MKKLFYILLVLVTAAKAQHTGDYIQYMFNGVLLNPAYCGSQNAVNVTALYRSQWVGISGAPESKSFTAHSPLKNKKLNVGVAFENNRFGIYDQNTFNAMYAYRIKFLEGRLSMGLQAGVNSNTSNWNKIVTTHANDNEFMQGSVRNINLIAGTGLYYDSKRFYLGLSCPQLLNNNSAKFRTIVLNSGFLFDLSDNIKVKPSLLIKQLNRSPLSVNVASTFYYKEVIGLGLGYTVNASVMAFIDVKINEQLRFGYGYDYAATKIRMYTSGSHEVMLRYLFSYKVKAVSARFF